MIRGDETDEDGSTTELKGWVKIIEEAFQALVALQDQETTTPRARKQAKRVQEDSLRKINGALRNFMVQTLKRTANQKSGEESDVRAFEKSVDLLWPLRNRYAYNYQPPKFKCKPEQPRKALAEAARSILIITQILHDGAAALRPTAVEADVRAENSLMGAVLMAFRSSAARFGLSHADVQAKMMTNGKSCPDMVELQRNLEALFSTGYLNASYDSEDVLRYCLTRYGTELVDRLPPPHSGKQSAEASLTNDETIAQSIVRPRKAG